MDEVEAAHLTRYVRAICPQQKFDEFTADAWYDVLFEFDYEDCRRAAAVCARESPFVAPAEIVAVVRRARAYRLRAHIYEPAPGEGVGEGIARRREQVRAVASGYPSAEIAARAGRPLLQLVPTESLASGLPPNLAAVIGPLRHPARDVRCPKDSCGVRPGFSCRAADRRIMPGGAHQERIAHWAVLRAGCPECGSDAGDPCVGDERSGPRRGTHDARVDLAEGKAA